MPRPKSKEELLTFSNQQFDKLNTFIDSFTPEQKTNTFQFEDRDRNVRDVLTHLYEWHLLLINWIESNLRKEEKHFLPDGYTWKTYGGLNQEFFKKHQTTSLEEATTLLKDSHERALNVIETLSNEELFTKKYYNWTGTTSVGSYCVSAMSSHYDWALKKLKKHKKTSVV